MVRACAGISNRMQAHLHTIMSTQYTHQREDLNTDLGHCATTKPHKSPTTQKIRPTLWQTTTDTWPQIKNKRPLPEELCSLSSTFQDSSASPSHLFLHTKRKKWTTSHKTIESARGPFSRSVFQCHCIVGKVMEVRLFFCLMCDPCVEQDSWWMWMWGWMRCRVCGHFPPETNCG